MKTDRKPRIAVKIMTGLVLMIMTLLLGMTEAYAANEFVATDEIEDGGIYIFKANISNNWNLSDPADRLLRATNDMAIKPYYDQNIQDWKTFTITSSTKFNVSSVDSNVIQVNNDTLYPVSNEDYRNYRFQITKVSGKTDDGNQGYRIKLVDPANGQNCAFRDYPYLGVGQTLQERRNVSELPNDYPEIGIVKQNGTFVKSDYYRLPTMPYVMMSDSSDNIWYWDSKHKAFYYRYTTNLRDLGSIDSANIKLMPAKRGETEGTTLHFLFCMNGSNDYDFIPWYGRLAFCNLDSDLEDYRGFGWDTDAVGPGVRMYLRGVNTHLLASDPFSTYYPTLSMFHNPLSRFTMEGCASLGVRLEREYDGELESYGWMPWVDGTNPDKAKRLDVQPLTLCKYVKAEVVYHKADGSTWKTSSKQYGETVDISQEVLPGESERFIGWSYTAGGERITNTTITVKSSINLYPVFKQSVEGADVSVFSMSYTGEALTPEPTVVLSGVTLREGTDYTVSYADNTNAGTGTVIITGTGNYYSTVRKGFTIYPIYVGIPAGKILSYNGEVQTGVKAWQDYTITDNCASEVGSYTAKLSLNDKINYQWVDRTTEDKMIDWAIVPGTVAVPSGKTLTFNGKAQTGIAAGAQYTLSGNTGTKAGAYTATATLKDNANYRWSDGTADAKKITWKINKAANPLTVKAKTGTVHSKKLKKKAQTLTVTKVITFTKKGQGTMIYKKLSGNKKITINKTTGKVIVKKGLKKGTYKVKVSVKAVGNTNYKASGWQTVTFTVKVK